MKSHRRLVAFQEMLKVGQSLKSGSVGSGKMGGSERRASYAPHFWNEEEIRDLEMRGAYAPVRGKRESETRTLLSHYQELQERLPNR